MAPALSKNASSSISFGSFPTLCTLVYTACPSACPTDQRGGTACAKKCLFPPTPPLPTPPAAPIRGADFPVPNNVPPPHTHTHTVQDNKTVELMLEFARRPLNLVHYIWIIYIYPLYRYSHAHTTIVRVLSPSPLPLALSLPPSPLPVQTPPAENQPEATALPTAPTARTKLSAAYKGPAQGNIPAPGIYIRVYIYYVGPYTRIYIYTRKNAQPRSNAPLHSTMYVRMYV